MKRIDNLKDMPNTQEVVINIPKNINVMIISYCYVDEKGELRLIQENINVKQLKELKK